MLKDRINRILLGVLVVMAVLYAVSYWLNTGSAGSQVFTKNLVNIDTAQVTNIKIEKSGRQIQLARRGGVWLLNTEENVEVPAERAPVDRMISSLTRMVPSRVASRDRDKWRDYQVDSTGQRVQVYQGENVVLDLIIGRGSMQGQQNFITYVRPYEEDNVYVIENFSGSSVSANSANYRDKNVLSTVVDSIRQLQFDYSGGGFTLLKEDDHWQLNNTVPDSTRVEEYLNELRRITSSAFVDQQQPAATASPSSSLIIRSNGAEDIMLRLFENSGADQILHSSQNPDNYFADTAVINQVFVDPEAFLMEDKDR